MCFNSVIIFPASRNATLAHDDWIIRWGVHTLEFVAIRKQRLGPLTWYVKLRVTHAPGMPGTFFPLPRVSDPNMHHGTCVTHVPWRMLGSLTSGYFEVGGGKNVLGIPGACATRNFMYLVRGPCTSATANWINIGDMDILNIDVIMHKFSLNTHTVDIFS